MALFEHDASGQQTVAYFTIDALSKDATRRFSELFARRAKWTLDDLRPYLQCVSTSRPMPIPALWRSLGGGWIRSSAALFIHAICRDLASDSKQLDALLLKHARSSAHPDRRDQKVYSSRYS